MATTSLTLHPILSFSPPSPSSTSRKRNTTKTALHATCQYKLQEGQSRHFHRLPCGLDLEVISQKPPSPSRSQTPPLVFVHGSFHAAWCWAEHWLPFFSHAGFDCFAVSLRAQGESSVPSEEVAGTLETHTGDIADFIRKKVCLPPVLIGHSFGGLIVQYYISCMQGSEHLHPKLAGAILVCSVPPSGNSGLVWRYLLTKPVAAVKVTLSLAAKAYANSLFLCKETFFSSQMDDELVQRYQELMKGSSKLPLFDLRKLNASLPVPSLSNNTLEILVMGANDDFIVVSDSIFPNKFSRVQVHLDISQRSVFLAFWHADAEGLSETASFYDVKPVCVEGVAHDMMLDCSWERGAEIILSWLDKLAPRSI